METSLNIDDVQMVNLNTLEMSVSSFRSKIQDRIMREATWETMIDSETNKFQIITAEDSSDESSGKKIIAQSDFKYLGQYTIPSLPVDPVYWKSPDKEYEPEQIFRPRTHRDCPDWLHTVLKAKVIELPDPMLVSIILGAMLDMGKFDTIGYIYQKARSDESDKMLAFGLQQVDWLVSEISDEERYTMPDISVIEKCGDNLRELRSHKHSKKKKDKKHSKKKTYH